MKLVQTSVIFVALALQVAFASPVLAQCGPQWLPTSGSDSARFGFGNGEVLAITLFDPDSEGPETARHVVAGSFTKTSAGESVCSVVMWDDYSWVSMGNSFGGVVSCLEVHDGQLYAGGSFTSVDGTIANGVVRWDGHKWVPITPQIGAASVKVTSICSYGEELVIFGPDLPPGVGAQYIARFDGTTWRSLGDFGRGIVTGIAVHEGALFISTRGSEFFPYGLARWKDQSLESVYVTRTQGSGPLQLWQLTAEDNKLCAVASVTGTDSWGLPTIAYTAIRQTSVPGSIAVTFETLPSLQYGSYATGLASYVDGQYVLADPSASGVITWSDASASWRGGAAFSLPSVRTFKRIGMQVFCGGGFVGHSSSPLKTSRLAIWESGNWNFLGFGISGNASRVTALCEYQGELVLAGSLQRVNGHAGHGLIRWNGSRYLEFPQQINGTVSTAMVWNEKLLAAGLFATPLSVGNVHAALWDGTQWNAMNDGLGSEGRASVVGVHKGELILGGDFRKVTGSAVDAIARWDGQAWRGLENATGFSIDGTPLTLLEFDGRLIVGGQFAMAGGKSASRIAAWNGSDWQSLGNGLSGTGSIVRSLANYKGQLLAGGTFSQSGSVGGIRNLARWTGSAWQQFAGGLNGGVQTLVTSGQDLLAGGSFTASGNVPIKRLARWSGTSWTEIGGGVDAPVSCILPREAEFVIGGDFATLGGKPSAFWGRLVQDATPQPGQAPIVSPSLAGQTTYVSAWPAFGFAELSGGLSYRWQRDGAPLQNGVSMSGASITGASGVLTNTRELTARIDNIQHAEAGSYSIRYWNSCGEATSIPVAIKVKAHIADINADGQVDDADFLLFTTQYDLMLCADPLMPDACSADFNQDGFVDDADFTVFIPAYHAMLFD